MSTNEVMDTSLTGRRRNRFWPEALKREIVAASFAPGASVSVVARHYDVNANQVFAWRKRFQGGRLFSTEPSPTEPHCAQLIPVTITAEPPTKAAGMIEIEGIGSYLIRVDSAVDGAALLCVLDVLERR